METTEWGVKCSAYSREKGFFMTIFNVGIVWMGTGYV